MNETKTLKLWNKNFILLWQGTLFSTFGDVLYSICIGYWVYEKTGSTALMGLLSSISMFVAMFLGPFCGAIIDRSHRKWMIVGTDLIRGLTMIGAYRYESALGSLDGSGYGLDRRLMQRFLHSGFDDRHDRSGYA